MGMVRPLAHFTDTDEYHINVDALLAVSETFLLRLFVNRWYCMMCLAAWQHPTLLHGVQHQRASCMMCFLHAVHLVPACVLHARENCSSVPIGT